MSGSRFTFRACADSHKKKVGYFVDDDVGYIDLALLAFWEL